MPIAIFSNRNQENLSLIIEPGGDRHEIPHQGTGGIRYTLEAGQEDRSVSDIWRNEIRFWCNAESYEVEIVHPSPFDMLLWEMCVVNGFCGGVTGDQPVHVTNLLPGDGLISAEAFAELAVQAECEVRSPEPQHRRWVERLAALFVKHLGAPVMPVQALKRNVRLPFEPPQD